MGGRSAAELNLTTLNRIASFLNVAPVMARNDVMIEEMTDSEWYLSGRSVGATSILDALNQATTYRNTTASAMSSLAHVGVKKLLAQHEGNRSMRCSDAMPRCTRTFAAYCEMSEQHCKWRGLEWHMRNKAEVEARALPASDRCKE